MILDEKETPDFMSVPEDELEGYVNKITPDLVTSLKKNEHFSSRFEGLVNDIRDYCKLNSTKISYSLH